MPRRFPLNSVYVVITASVTFSAGLKHSPLQVRLLYLCRFAQRRFLLNTMEAQTVREVSIISAAVTSSTGSPV